MENVEQLSEKIFDFAYGCALPDATLQRAFKGKKSWIANVTGAKEAVKEYIDFIIRTGPKSPIEHDNLFIKTAKTICTLINAQGKTMDFETDIFTFGNAQKLINMTVKHMYAVCYVKPELRTHFQFCHCPMDSIMIDKVWKEYYKEANTIRSDEFHKSWSQEEFEAENLPERYLAFQNGVRELANEKNIFPLEYDFFVWKQSDNN